MNIGRVQVGINYQDLFGQRFKFKAGLSGGFLTGDKVHSIYVYKDKAGGDNTDYTNKKIRRTEEFSINSSFACELNTYLELLPNPSKNRKRPIAPFVELNLYRSVPNGEADKSIEEWVDDNFVYKEHIDYSKWGRSSLNIWLGAGIKWYFK